MLGILFVIFACFVWALDTLIRYPLMGEGYSAENIVFIEHLLLCLFLLPVLYKSREKFLNIKLINFLDFVIIGGLGSALATICFTKAFVFINPSIVILLQKFQPIIAIIFARIILKENIKEKFLVWALIAFIGGAMVAHREIIPALKLLNIGTERITINEGYFYAFVAVFSWALATVFGKKLSLQGFSTTEIMTGRFWLGFIAIIIFNSILSWEVNFDFSAQAYIKILLMVSISGLLGMYLYYNGLKRIPAKVCALCEMFFPLCAVLINWIFLDASLDLWQVIGAGLLITSSLSIQIKHY